MEFKPSELILNEDGSIFHLKLKPGEIANDILLVGDPGRVDLIAGFFESIEVNKHNREFKTVTGTYKGKRITVISSGIGTDNIDIVVNELDAITNIDTEQRKVKKQHTPLNFIRVGTSGAIQENIPVGSFVVSEKSIGFDNLLHFYSIDTGNEDMTKALKKHLHWNEELPFPYIVDAGKNLYESFQKTSKFISGVNISSPGFYGPQGRKLRIPHADNALNNKIESFQYNKMKITNYEMESSAIYSLSKSLGHNALTVCAIIANRITKDFAGDYKPIIKNLVKEVLEITVNK
ncbi:MAG: nucleoside phosphorylase [Bacteroidales bacterium]